jgi:deoxyribonuclease V
MVSQVWDGRPLEVVAAADVGFPDKQTVLAAVVAVTYPGLSVIETSVVEKPCKFPYVPGLLAFREAPAVLAAWRRIKTRVDLLLCDGQGLAHPRGMGLATHVGVLLDQPVVGCAKSHLYGSYGAVPPRKGRYAYMLGAGDEIVGAALRTRRGVQPVFVSVGNRIDLATAIAVVLKCCRRYRLPEPLRLAHRLSVGGEVSIDAEPA